MVCKSIMFYMALMINMPCSADYAMDMWSIGCVIFELFTGKILFPGHSNNEMIKLMMDVKVGYAIAILVHERTYQCMDGSSHQLSIAVCRH